MTKQEAIEWLERNKQYLRAINRDTAGLIIAIDMAIEAIRASDPRVLTIEEVRKLPVHTPLWVEYIKDGLAVGETKPNGTFEHVTVMIDRNEQYRFWSAYPTAEQMQATPWKESETE